MIDHVTSISSEESIELGLDETTSVCECFGFLVVSRRNTDLFWIAGLRLIDSNGSEGHFFRGSFFCWLAKINSWRRLNQASRMGKLGVRKMYLLPECISYSIKHSPALSVSWAADSSFNYSG